MAKIPEKMRWIYDLLLTAAILAMATVLCTLLRRLAHDEGKCIFFSTHELDIALTLCDAVALIDPPRLHLLPTDEMIRSGHIERLFDNGTVAFDASTRTVTVRR